MGDLTFDEAYENYKLAATAAEKAGADLAIIETMADLHEIKAAVLAVRENTNLPIITTVTFQPNLRTLTGADVRTCVVYLESLGTDAIGFNCGGSLREDDALAEEFMRYAHKPVLIQPNAGIPTVINGKTVYMVGPDEFAEHHEKYRKLGASILGGCCGTTPEYIKEVVKAVLPIKNERAKVDYIVSEGLINHHLYKDEADREEKVQQALREVGLLPEFASRFPHEFSGGQRQRIGIARALIMQPEFIVADEPISALDVSIRAQVLNLLNSLKQSRGLTYLFIAHDLSVVRFISDRIAVIRKGRIVELSEAEELFRHPLHPYTKSLLSAVPNPDPAIERNKKLLVYDPSMHDYSVDKPEWVEILPGHFVYGNTREMDGYRRELAAL